MNKSDNIFIAGHKGLVGSSVLRLLKNKGYRKIIVVDKKKLDLRNYEKVKKFFKKKKLDYMIIEDSK
jgi:GDP-L-fucose synthase